MRRAKGQVAMEFFIYSAVFLAAVLAAYFAVSFIQVGDIYNKETLYVKWFGESFPSHINTAMSGQQGFNYTMKFDKDILGKPYDIYIKPASGTSKGFVYIEWRGNNASYTYPIGSMDIVLPQGGDDCIDYVSQSGQAHYYRITPSKGRLNFYNNGNALIMSQGGGCS